MNIANFVPEFPNWWLLVVAVVFELHAREHLRNKCYPCSILSSVVVASIVGINLVSAWQQVGGVSLVFIVWTLVLMTSAFTLARVGNRWYRG